MQLTTLFMQKWYIQPHLVVDIELAIFVAILRSALLNINIKSAINDVFQCGVI